MGNVPFRVRYHALFVDVLQTVSGVPVRNGSSHATDICAMAQDLFETSAYITSKLELMMGIHSGMFHFQFQCDRVQMVVSANF